MSILISRTFRIDLGVLLTQNNITHINASNHDFLSNQSLGGFTALQANLGGDGAGNFNGDVSLIDLNSFTGNQFFSVTVVPEPSTMALLGVFSLSLVTRRR